METTRLSTKGQIILPKSIRSARAWKPGTEFTVEPATDGVFLRAARLFPKTRLEDVAGCLPAKRTSHGPARLQEAIAKEVKRRHDRGRY